MYKRKREDFDANKAPERSPFDAFVMSFTIPILPILKTGGQEGHRKIENKKKEKNMVRWYVPGT